MQLSMWCSLMYSHHFHSERYRFVFQRPDHSSGIHTSKAIPGLFIGCLIGNILGGAILPDIIFGSIATLIGAFFTWKLREKSPYLAPVPPIIANILIVPFVLRYGYGVALPIPFMMCTVGIGEIISCAVLGMVLYFALKKYAKTLFAQ